MHRGGWDWGGSVGFLWLLVTNHKLGGLKQQTFTLTVLEAEVQNKVSAGPRFLRRLWERILPASSSFW